MKNHLALLAGLVALAGCSDVPTGSAAAAGAEDGTPSFAYWGGDNDGDGLDDGTEWDLANQYAPNIWQLMLGAAMLAIIMFLPSGLWSLLRRTRRTAP